MNSEISTDEAWQVIEEYGIDRKLLENTNPSNELILQLYRAIKQTHENQKSLQNSIGSE